MRKKTPRKPSAPAARAVAPPWALALLASVAALCLVVSVSFQIFDTDLWQHLVRGKAMMALHSIPRQQHWTWPMYGSPERGNSGWAFAFLIWPFWSLGGVTGLFVWRWLAMLSVFGVAWATARRLGARGLSAIVVVFACAIMFRARSQVRPEVLAALLMALELWILETRRAGGADRAWWLVPLSWLWPNVHMSFFLGWLIVIVFAVAERLERRPRATTPRVALGMVLLAQIAVAFLNPLGTEVFRLPYEFFTSLRHEPLYQVIGELRPIDWSINWQNGLPILMVAWPALQIWRWRRGRFDIVEALLCVVFTVWAYSAVRFLTFWATAASPYLARGAGEWLAARRLPRWTAAPAWRVAVGTLACVTLAGLEQVRSGFPMGIAVEPHSVPATACDFIGAQDIRGRAFNYFEQGGYMLWRFWPERGRLPFMTTAPEMATPAMRLAYQRAMVFSDDWRRMDARYHFDYVLLKRLHEPGDKYLDILDADSTFALVFVDDVSALYVKRGGPLGGVADRFGYRWVSGGRAGVDATGDNLDSVPAVREAVRQEFDRAIRSSPLHAGLEAVRAALLGPE